MSPLRPVSFGCGGLVVFGCVARVAVALLSKGLTRICADDTDLKRYLRLLFCLFAS
jgi:hypothetical protein